MEKLLSARGIVPVREDEVPDVCVVNTCSVTALADSKCRQHIRSLHRRYPQALLVVTGCYAQLKSQEVAELEGVDIVLGSEQKLDIATYVTQWLADHDAASTTGDSVNGNAVGQIDVTPSPQIRRFSPSCERGDRTRYWLKVQDGCDYYCSYCTIPMARGRSRCGTIASLVEQAQQVASEGGREIVLTGVNIGDYGKGTGEKFIDLLRALDEIEGIERYRISSIEPDLLSDEIIDFVAHSRAFMPHFHIPLQCGNDEVLRLMRRHYDRQLFADKVALCRQLMPHCFIGVDVMVGTRGETPEHFDDSRNFIASLDVQHLHVFPYSERPGTLALRIPYIVSQADKRERAAQMIALSDSKQRQFIERHLGTTRRVLVEQSHGSDMMHGFTDNYIRVNLERNDELVNRLVDVELGTTIHDDMSVDATLKKQ